MRVTVDVDTGPAVSLLRQIAAAGGDPRPALAEIAEDFYAEVDRVFATEGRSAGQAWASLSPGWLRRRQREGHGSAILRMQSPRGGKLLRSLTGRSSGAGSHLRRISADELVVGTRLGIAGVHQHGGTLTSTNRKTGRTRRVTIPARPFVAVTPRSQERWAAILQRHLVGASSARGL